MHLVTVENGRVVKVRPDPEGPLNKGRACVKGMTILEQMYHPDRLTVPLRRIGPKRSSQWQEITWEEAYDLMTEKLRHYRDTYGPQSIALTTGTGRHHLAQYWRFANVLGTPNATSSGALICLGPRKNAGEFTAGVFAGVDYYGDTPPAGILVWGANPAVSGADGELQWHIKDAVKRGTPLIVVDPHPNELTKAAALWLRLRPGTDGVLALSILHVLIEEGLYDEEFVSNWTVGMEELRQRCQNYPPEQVAEITWVPAEDIRRAARLIASIKPLSLEWGCAVEQTSNSFQTCRAIFMIPALTGNWDVPGGFVPSKDIAPSADLLFDRLPEEQKGNILSGPFPLNDGTASPKMFAHPWLTFEAMKTGKPYRVRALLAHANNSLLSMPDAQHVYEGLEQVEFFVYMDFFKTPTAEFADLLLPAALWPELDSYYPFPEFGDEALLCQQKLVQVGQCKSDEEVFQEIARRLGLDYGAESQEEILNQGLSAMGEKFPAYRGMDFHQLKQLGYVVPPRTYYNYKTQGFHTPSGKFELYSQRLKDSGADPLPYWVEDRETPVSQPQLAKEYPLVLTTGRRSQPYFISNGRQIKSLRKLHPFPLVSLHPDTAAQYGIRDGDWVWIQSPRGRITQKAMLVPQLDPRVVNCEMGWWYPEAGAPDYGWRESNVNLLTIGSPPGDPFSGAYPLRGLLCRIEKNEDCGIEERYERWVEAGSI
jgi:anaerobic selenocysteine-containing dehydrogenase